MSNQKKSGGGRKIGRHSVRSPAAKIYKMVNRREVNKQKHLKRARRQQARAGIHRLRWEIRKGKTTVQAAVERLQEYKQLLSQNL